MFVEGTGAELLAESLYHAGIEVIFGVPGDTGVAFYDALYQRSDRIRHVLARDERSAAMMADVYARCRNRVGVVEASSGGGATFLVGGLGEPYAASVPMLVITSDIQRGSRGTGALTELDQERLFSAVTKWQATVPSAADIPRLVAAALTEATSGRPAPVSLVLPEDVLDERARAEILTAAATVPRGRPSADPRAIAEAADALDAAARPAVVAGSGVHLSGGWAELRQLVETVAAPVATTIHGKGAYAEARPWSLGVVGANGAREYANEYLAAADVVLFVGTRANATDTHGFTSPPRRGPRVIQVDIDPQRAGRNFPGSLALVGDAKTVLAQLVEAVAPAGAERRERLSSWLAERRATWRIAGAVALDSHGGEGVSASTNAGQGAITPDGVVTLIRELAGPDTVVVGDPGTPTPYLAACWETATAARGIIIPRGHGPMGYAIPGAIGAAVAFPDRGIVSLTTDGSFGMSCGELETAVRLELPIIYVYFRNGALGWIKMLQHLYLDQRYFGVDLGPVDAVAVARACGLEAAHATTLDEFRAAFSRGLQSRRPTLIDVPVPEQRLLVPPVAPWTAALAGQAGRPVY